MPQSNDSGSLLCSGGAGLGLGALCFVWKWSSSSYAKRLQDELDVMKAMPTSGVNAAVSEAMKRGFGKGVYVELSGQSWTEKPLTTSQGLSALAIQTAKFEKFEDYAWVDGAKIFEDRIVDVTEQRNGRQVTTRKQQRVDTGRREEGHWLSSEHTRKVEDNTVTAETGVCFRQLGAVDGLLSSPSQVCLNLDRCNLHELIQEQKLTTKFEPNTASIVNVTMNSTESAKQKPPARVLGWETHERAVPLGKEVYSLGNVSWRQAASVGGIQGQQGAVAILQPAAGKPFIFGFGSEDYFQEQREKHVARSQNNSWILDKLGYTFMGVGGLAFAVGLSGVGNKN